MSGKHAPGYWGRRYRVQQHILDAFKAAHPDEYERAWADGEERERNQQQVAPPPADPDI